ncbi:MAG: NAD+ synthase [Planctomycetes bacterium]|nr:NAD+ synthase [Planctomycetota bacterium]
MTSIPPPPTCNVELAERVLVGFLKSETQRIGMHKAVLGMSGGIDSALVLELAVRALGPENVMAVALPYRESSPLSLELAQQGAKNARCQFSVIDISPLADAYFDQHPELAASDSQSARLRRGNVFSRLRMTALYDQSAALNGLVFGTSNKTELLLGYGTQHGDMASAINPIGDMYKSQVVALSRHLGVPSDIIDRPPSADLWHGQTDEEELGFSYDTVDALLHAMVEQRLTKKQLGELNFDTGFIDEIQMRVQRNQYKRRPPLIAKLTGRTVNLDYRYARDWGT